MTDERADAKAWPRAISAWQAAVAEQRRRSEWLAIGLPHNSSYLFARLPFDDAIRLAALVGTGQMSWAEVNAALDARIKLAMRQDDPHGAGEAVMRAAEDEIWARYHAKCDALFADDSDEARADSWSRGQLRDRERILNRLRSERDRALAALCRRLDPRQASCATRLERPTMQLTTVERDALSKLNASGFAGSQAMLDAIRDLATSLAGSIADSA